jgi:hypothetical protein
MEPTITVSVTLYERLVRIAQEVLTSAICAEKQMESIDEWLDAGMIADDIRNTLTAADVRQAEERAAKLTNFKD